MARSVINTQTSPINTRSRSPMRAPIPTKPNPDQYGTSKLGTHNVRKTNPLRQLSPTAARGITLKGVSDILLSWCYDAKDDKDDREYDNRMAARGAILSAIYSNCMQIDLTSLGLTTFPEGALKLLNQRGTTRVGTLHLIKAAPLKRPPNRTAFIFQQLDDWAIVTQRISLDYEERKAVRDKIIDAYTRYQKSGQPVDLALSRAVSFWETNRFPIKVLSLFEIRTLNITGQTALIDDLMGRKQRAGEEVLKLIKNISHIETDHHHIGRVLSILKQKNGTVKKDGELLYQFHLENKAIDGWIRGARFGENRKEAFSRIMTTFLERQSSVDLSGLGLTSLPDNLDFFLYKASNLNLSNNRLHKFTENFSKLNLVSLNLENNRIVSIEDIPAKFKFILRERGHKVYGNSFFNDFSIRNGRVILSDKLQGSSIDEMLVVARIGFWKIFNEWIKHHKPGVTLAQKYSLFNQCGLLYSDSASAYKEVAAWARDELGIKADFPKKLFDMMSTLTLLERTRLYGAQYANDYDKVLQKIMYSYLTQDEMVLNLDNMGLIKIPENPFEPVTIFSRLPIKSLSLANNRIKAISTERYPMQSNGRFLSSLPEMEVVDLTNNGMDSLYLANNATRIGQLKFSGNNIQTRDPSVLMRLDEQDLERQSLTTYGLFIPSKEYNTVNKYQHFLKLLKQNLREWTDEPGRYPDRFLNISSGHVYRNRTIASNEIIKAYEGKRSTLDLSNCDVINIPESIIYLQNLNHLIIRDDTRISEEVIRIMDNGSGKRLQITRNTGQERITENLAHTMATELVQPSSGTDLFVDQKNIPALPQPIQSLLRDRA